MAGRKRAEITGNGPRADLARRLRLLRDESKLTLRTLAGKSGYAIGSLSAAEGGRRVPTWELVEAFVQACGDNPAQWRQLWEVAQSAPDSPDDAVRGADGDAGAAPGARVRPRHGRTMVVTVAVAAVVSAGVVLALKGPAKPEYVVAPLSVASFSPPARAVAAEDDTDPYDDHCKADDKQLDWQSVRYADGAAFGTLILMFSPSCDAAWGYLSGPNSTRWTVHILTHRDPGEKTLTFDYSGNAPTGSWGNVLSTRDGCVYVEAYVTDRHGNGPHAKTACLQPKLPAAP